MLLNVAVAKYLLTTLSVQNKYTYRPSRPNSEI